MEQIAVSLATLAVVLGKTVADLVKDRKYREACETQGDCYLPEDRRQARAVHENIIKMCIKNGIDPEV